MSGVISEEINKQLMIIHPNIDKALTPLLHTFNMNHEIDLSLSGMIYYCMTLQQYLTKNIKNLSFYCSKIKYGFPIK